MLSRSLALAAGSSLLLLPIVLYYFYRKRPSSDVVGNHVFMSADSKTVVIDEFVFNKEQLTLRAAEVLTQLLNSPDSDMRYRALTMVQQASAFSDNFPLIRDSQCLNAMLKLLENEEDVTSAKRQNLCILQILTNLVCDISCLEILKDHMNKLFMIAFTLEYSDEACAALQVLCNIALTPIGCRCLDARLLEIFGMLKTADPYMLRQVFTLLVNISCDSESCELILASEVPGPLVNKICECLSPYAQPLVSLQLVNLLKNLYRAIASSQDGFVAHSDFPSIREYLLNSRVALKLRVQFFISEPSTVGMNQELLHQAESLLGLLDSLKLHSYST